MPPTTPHDSGALHRGVVGTGSDRDGAPTDDLVLEVTAPLMHTTPLGPTREDSAIGSRLMRALSPQMPQWVHASPPLAVASATSEGSTAESGDPQRHTSGPGTTTRHEEYPSASEPVGVTITAPSTTEEPDAGLGPEMTEPLDPEPSERDLPEPTASRTRRSDSDTSQHHELSAMHELQMLVRRGYHSLPFLALFLVYLAYQHTAGILVFICGTVAIFGLDHRVCAQIALKDNASLSQLGGILAMAVMHIGAISAIAGDVNPLHHLSRRVGPHASETKGNSEQTSTSDMSGLLWDVVFVVLVNDFLLRFLSVIVKLAIVAMKAERCSSICARSRRRRGGAAAPNGSGSSGLFTSVDEADEEEQRRKDSRSTAAFYRRKRKLYGIVELVSIMVRSTYASIPWYSYYKLCSSPLMGNVLTFVYIVMKSFVVGSHGRILLRLFRSFASHGLQHATYLSTEDLIETGEPDCAICYDAMHTPVKLACSHVFCEECVMEWFDRERSCPLCRASVTPNRRGQSDESTDNSISGSERDDEEEVNPRFLDGSTSLLPQLL